MECIFENPEEPKFSLTKIDFNENGLYDVTCKNGHSYTTILQQQKFEILFDIGAYAIQDGYYREAVSSFTSSLERLYEFFIKAVCLSKNINMCEITSTWSEVNLSERQLGAFAFLYLITTGKSPKSRVLLSNKKRKFRNDVIHNGMIPSKQSAIDYGQTVLDIARPIINILKNELLDSTNYLIREHVSTIHSKTNSKTRIETSTLTTIISLTYAEPGHDDRKLVDILPNLFSWSEIDKYTKDLFN